MNTQPTDVFAALGNDIRLRCLMLLLSEGELCVCELTHAIGAPQPYISRHLAQLRAWELVSDRRRGLWVYYRLHPQLPAWVQGVLRETRAGVAEQAPFARDARALAEMPNRPSAARCA